MHSSSTVFRRKLSQRGTTLSMRQTQISLDTLLNPGPGLDPGNLFFCRERLRAPLEQLLFHTYCYKNDLYRRPAALRDNDAQALPQAAARA